MDHFELVSEYKPTGDQPQAIEQLVKGFKEGNQCETLLGVTGSGKTFTDSRFIKHIFQSAVKPELYRRFFCSYTFPKSGILYHIEAPVPCFFQRAMLE